MSKAKSTRTKTSHAKQQAKRSGPLARAVTAVSPFRDTEQSLLYSSVILNVLFASAIIGMAIWWYRADVTSARIVHEHLTSQLCPDDLATNKVVSSGDGVETTTYEVTQAAVDSGCLDGLISGAQAGDYMAHPDHAAIDATAMRKDDAKNLLHITVLKDAATGKQIAPTRY
ncbi:MAG TPA: hypothetical protein VMY99_02645 [Nevskiaceae bacterium]|nr:hypothetical protein [Nevskiaceae bacterium]